MDIIYSKTIKSTIFVVKEELLNLQLHFYITTNGKTREVVVVEFLESMDKHRDKRFNYWKNNGWTE